MWDAPTTAALGLDPCQGHLARSPCWKLVWRHVSLQPTLPMRSVPAATRWLWRDPAFTCENSYSTRKTQLFLCVKLSHLLLSPSILHHEGMLLILRRLETVNV